MTGLQVAPTAPKPIESCSSSYPAVSVQRQVGVVWVISCSGPRYWLMVGLLASRG